MKKALVLLSVAALAGCTSTVTQPTLEFDSVVLGDNQSITQAQPSQTGSATEPGVTESPATPAPSPSETSESEEREHEYATDRYAEIEIEDQAGDGSTIQIHEIHVSAAASHLVIYDKTGMVLGNALVTPQSQPVNIKLQIPITSSQELEAVLYLDDGDGDFDLEADSPILDDDRDLVHEDFYYRVTTSG